MKGHGLVGHLSRQLPYGTDGRMLVPEPLPERRVQEVNNEPAQERPATPTD
jgi:hypothetical protein